MMYPAVLSLLASAYLALTPLQANAPAVPQPPAPSASAPKTAFNFVPVGKTTYSTVFIDTSSVVIDKDPDGNQMYGMIVKIELNEPVKQNGVSASTIINLIAASCALESIMVLITNALDENGKSVGTSEKQQVLRWTKGSDSATNVIMSKLCAGAAPKKNIKGSANI